MKRLAAARRIMEVRGARLLSPTVRELELRTADGGPYEFLAGQWIKLYLADGLDRDYSIANAPDPARPDRVVLAVTRVEGGPGSERLHRIAVGERLETLGPSGFFVREPEHRALPAIYVGTGTGLAPLRAMLEEELRCHEGAPQVLLFGCRTEADLLWRDELEAWAAAFPRFRFEPTLSRPSSGWRGRRGWVQEHLEALVRPALPAHVYVCGLSRMVHDVRRRLKEEIGIDRRLLHSERYD